MGHVLPPNSRVVVCERRPLEVPVLRSCLGGVAEPHSCETANNFGGKRNNFFEELTVTVKMRSHRRCENEGG